MGQCAGIDHNAVLLSVGSVDFIDDIAFMVGLENLQFKA